LIRVLHPAPLPTTVLLLESALTDVLTVVLSLGLLRALTPGEVVTAGSMIGGIARAFLFAALVGAAGAFIWSAILPKVRQFPNTVFTTVAYVLILYGITELWGFSGAIAALMFGIAVANLPNIPERVQGRVISFRLVGFAEVERTFFSEAVFLVKTFFFVFLGISIGLSDWTTVAIGFLLAAVAFGGRAVIIRLLASKETTRRDAMLMTALIPKGLAAAVLAALPAQRGIAGGEVIQGTVYAVIFFSIILCALFVFVIEGGRMDRVAAWFFRPFALTPPGGQPRPPSPDVALFETSLGLPPKTEAWHEPNPVTLDGTPASEEAPDDQPPDYGA
jgi:NhaP-type Na+/H+ or K+/H+ antiporter